MDTNESNITTNQAIFTFRGKKFFVNAEITVAQALKRIGLDPDAHLVIRQGELLTEDLLVHAGDEIRVVPVISGGSEHAL